MIRALALVALLPAPAMALDVEWPFPVLGQEVVTEDPGSYALPTGPWADGALPVQVVEGAVDRRAVRLDAGDATLLGVLAPLRGQVLAAGYRVLLDCEARACGGFDFRFATEVLPEPVMHVDLSEYRFLSATRPGEALSLLVSRSETAVFVQLIRVGGALPAADVGPTAPAAPSPPVLIPDGTLEGLLDAGLPAPLDDLVFAPGQAALAGGDYASLAALAVWLKADPARQVVLVGHTDVSGAMAANIALSRARAEAARLALVQALGVPPGQVAADGVGPLSPRASNDTEEGRRKNRRVEAVRTSTRSLP